MVWEALLNVLKSVSSYFQHTLKLVNKKKKKKSAVPHFSNLLLSVWKSDKTLFLVFDIIHEILSKTFSWIYTVQDLVADLVIKRQIT